MIKPGLFEIIGIVYIIRIYVPQPKEHTFIFYPVHYEVKKWTVKNALADILADV